MSFNTVEDFWSMYNHIEYVSKLATGCDYSFFKTGIKPMWEDEANNKGGKWLISLDRVQRNSGTIDNIWSEIFL
jgi:translation initiation factor 4E